MTDTKIGCVQHDCAKCKALEAQVNTCGSGAGCLHKDARIEALKAEVEVDNRNLEQLSDEVNALRKQLAVTKQAQPERAQPEKPIAYFEFQERGFYWAPNTAIGPVPVAVKVEPMPLYSNQQAQPERAPLSEDEIFKALDADIAAVEDAKADAESWETIVNMVRAIEAAHGIKQGSAA